MYDDASVVNGMAHDLIPEKWSLVLYPLLLFYLVRSRQLADPARATDSNTKRIRHVEKLKSRRNFWRDFVGNFKNVFFFQPSLPPVTPFAGVLSYSTNWFWASGERSGTLSGKYVGLFVSFES